ncbi:secretion-regulating guanine nucleotide exchange factor [Elysia marginata]|uniref:Secretion-regulating guanine nucleotide exchange factor n=1 Tax=Elysia marginata TaxID=1093978 RepID=A0AAV4I629_9GAST|nr:secretion-regulating guanine nucleotide exchange factor [Elysia marginata]
MTTVDERAVWTVWAWGANNCGQLGCGHREDVLVPTPLEMSGTLVSDPSLSHPDSDHADFTESRPALAVKHIVGGGAFSVLLTEAGHVLTCGKNDRGQLGQKTATEDETNGKTDRHLPDRLVFAPSLLTSRSSLKITQVVTGWDFVLALADGTTLERSFACGMRYTNYKAETEAIKEALNMINNKISKTSKVVILSDIDTGTVLSWGSNSFGQLGRNLPDGVKMDPTPQPVSSSSSMSDTCKFVSVAAGLRHALAVSDEGHVYSWGSGRRGQLGVVDLEGKSLLSTNVPVLVTLTDCDKAAKAVAGMNFSGILTETGTVFLWGCNKFGQCGVSPESEVKLIVPTSLKLPDEVLKSVTQKSESNITSLAAGWTHMVSRTESGTLYSWGRADMGQLGRNTDIVPHHIPGHIVNLMNITSHCCSSEHNLALSGKGQVYSWGWNEHGICGTGDETNVFLPQLIPNLENKIAVTVGCGAGHCFCWTVSH